MAFPFLTVFMVFIIGLSIRYAVLNKRREEKFDRFWEKEKEADHTPAKDLSTVTFLKVPIQSFPMGKWEDDEIAMIEERLRALSEAFESDRKDKYGIKTGIRHGKLRDHECHRRRL